jgi:hypothetical protein
MGDISLWSNFGADSDGCGVLEGVDKGVSARWLALILYRKMTPAKREVKTKPCVQPRRA